MGKLIDIFKQKCENCSNEMIPLGITGRYVTGEPARIIQCPICSYLRFLGQLGVIGQREFKRKVSGGRLAKILIDAHEEIFESSVD